MVVGERASQGEFNNFNLIQAQVLSTQWHLNNKYGPTINVLPVWPDYTGQGVTVGVVDTGIQYTNPELDENYHAGIDYDAILNSNDGSHRSSNDWHGTAVAGIIASENDGIGSTGVAYNAQISSYRFLGAGTRVDSLATDLVDIIKLQAMRGVDISNNSWGFSYAFGGNEYATQIEKAFQYGVSEGRNGLGTIYVFSAGNSRSNGYDTNYFELENSRFNIEVAASGSDGKVTYFSTPGASILVTAPGSAVYTTDLMGSQGISSTNYATVSGTSFSAPIVSGVVALMLEANPNLGYRDVQEILAYSAQQIDKGNASWSINGATHWNGGGLHVSNDYGFGLVDAKAAVRLAETWHVTSNTPSTFYNEHSTTQSSSALNWALNDFSTLNSALSVNSAMDVQHVEVQLNLSHSNVGDLVIKLTSPNGTESVLMNRPANGWSSNAYDSAWSFSSTHYWGETGVGKWTLSITDAAGADTGLFKGWTLKLYGDNISSNNTYIFTNEYGELQPSNRSLLTDSSGIDTLNAAATDSNNIFNLNPGTISRIDGAALIIAPNTWIEHAFGGDGNDSIRGNALSNKLLGGRGNDTLDGDGGHDVLNGGSGDDVYLIRDYWGIDRIEDSDGFDTISLNHLTMALTIDFNTGSIASGENQLTWQAGAIEAIRSGAGNDTLIGSDDSNILNGGEGNDYLIGGAGDDIYMFDANWSHDTIVDASGSDTFDFRNFNAPVVIAIGESQATGINSEAIPFTADSIENLTGSVFNDTLLGNALDNILQGHHGNDILNGGEGNDTLWGGNGHDAYVFKGSWGHDVIYNTQGNDSLDLSDLHESISLNLNLDTFLWQVVNSIHWNSNAIANITSGEGADQLTGNGLSNLLNGNAGNDYLVGASGHDTLIGSSGKDILRGAKGKDRLYGDDGKDILIGGPDKDTLFGGAGNDLYTDFSRKDSLTIISDLSGPRDVLDLHKFDLSDIRRWTARDTGDDTDRNVDALIIDFYGKAKIRINGYFDNSGVDDDASGHGDGYIERIIFDDDGSVNFGQVQELIC